MSDLHDELPVKDVSEVHRTKSLVMDKEHRLLRRDEYQDRIHQLTDENVFLKKHSRKFEEKAKQLEAKLNRILSEKKFVGKKDEIDAEESRHRIIELEYQVGMLKDKLQVAKQQLVSYTRLFPVHANKQIKSKSKVPASNSSSVGVAPINPELSEQFEILLLEIKAENQALTAQGKNLRDQVRSLQRELESSKQLLQIKEVTYEDEIKILRAQLGDADGGKKKLAENIQLIRLQRDSRRATSWLSTLEAQCKALESNLSNAQETSQQLEAQLTSAQEELRDAQQTNLNLQKQVEDGLAEISRVKELETQIASMKEENVILKEANDSLQERIRNAGEKVRKVEGEEANLKSHISQMETTLKKEIQSKTDLYSEVSREKTKCQTLTETLTELQRKFSAMESELRRLEERSAASISVPVVTYLEPGRKNAPSIVASSESQVCEDKSTLELPPPDQPPSTSELVRAPTPELVKAAPDEPDPSSSPCGYCKTLEKDLTSTRTTMNKLHDDLNKTKNLLKTQMNTNRECHKEIEALSDKLEKADKFHHEKLHEFMKVLEERAVQMQNLEKNLEIIKSQSRVSTQTSDTGIQVESEGQVQQQPVPPIPHVPSVEIFIDKFIPVEEQKHLFTENLFATWEYNEEGTKYSPVVQNGSFSSGSTHSLDANNFQNKIQVQIHQAIGSSDCQTLGSGILLPEKNSCLISSVGAPEQPLGELKYKFIVKGADMKNILSVPVEMPKPLTKPPSSSPKKQPPVEPPVMPKLPQKTNNDANNNTTDSEEGPATVPPKAMGTKPLPVPKPRRLTTQVEVEQGSSSSVTELSEADNNNTEIATTKPRRTKKKRIESTTSSSLKSPQLPRKGESKVPSPKKPILLHRDSVSPEVKRLPKKVTVTEIVEERRIPTPEDDDKSGSSEGTYEIARPSIPANYPEISGDGSDLTLVKKLAADAGFQIPVIKVQSADGPEPSNHHHQQQHPPPKIVRTTTMESTTTATEYSSGSAGESPLKKQQQPASSSESLPVARKKKKSGKTTKPTPLGSEESFETNSSSTTENETSSQDSESYKQSVRIEISYIIFNSPCRIWTDSKVKKIFVEYRFLDFNPEELETPNSVTKPQPGKRAEFNFVKVFVIDTKERRRLLQGMLREKKRIRFTVVSEPGENDTLDCEDIGYAYVPLTALAKEDFVQEIIKVYDAENPRLEMGSLCVSIQARQVLKSM